MRSTRLCIISGLVLALVTTLAWAQQPLKPQQVDAVIKVFEELQATDALDSLEDMEDADPTNPAHGVRAWLQDMTNIRDFLTLLSRHGLTPEIWSDAAPRVIMAYASLKLSEDPELVSQIQEARKAITDNPNLTAQEKQAILHQMDASLHAYDSPTIEADKKAVRPFIPRLDSLD